MRIKRLVCLLFVTVLLAGMVSVQAYAYYEDELSPTEVFLTPEQVDENTYFYRDESGKVVAVWENITAEDHAIPYASNGEQVHWDIQSLGYKHGNYYFDTNGGTGIYVSIDFSPEYESYLGYYTARYNEYDWITPPSNSGFHTRLTFTGSMSFTMAIKNMGPKTCSYEGYYYTYSI